MAKNIQYSVKLLVSGKEQLAVATTSVNKLRTAVINFEKSNKIQNSFIGLGAVVTTINQLTKSFQNITDSLENITADARDFSDAMREVNTLAGKDDGGLKEMQGQLNELSKSLPIARDELARGLKQVISSDIPEDNWFSYLEQSTKASIGGIADLNEVVAGTATIIKTYGMSWKDAGAIQDKMQLTAKVGETTFEELAASLPQVSASAATLGVSFDELMGVYASLTGVSGDTAEVSTQLAAVLNSLIKPSKEAANTAREMGLQFDAAAVKAAGGFEPFLEGLMQSIQAYSQSSGMIEEEIAGRLFGSARALRALIPITGELKDTFLRDIGLMSESAGTIDNAFSEMSKTSTAKAQLLKNSWSGVGDFFEGLFGEYLPQIKTGIQAVTTFATAFVVLTTAIKSAAAATLTHKAAIIGHTIATAAHTVALKAAAAAQTLWANAARFANRMQIAWAFGAKAFVVKTVAMQVALKGLMVATGVGLAIAAVTTIIGLFGAKAGEAAESAKELSESEQRLQSVTQAAAESVSAAKAEYELYVSKLKDFHGSKEQEKALITELNEKYGESFGTYETAAAWYDTLISKSQTYCKQLENEAKRKVLQEQYEETFRKESEIRPVVEQNVKDIKAGTYKNYVVKPTGKTERIAGVDVPTLQKDIDATLHKNAEGLNAVLKERERLMSGILELDTKSAEIAKDLREQNSKPLSSKRRAEVLKPRAEVLKPQAEVLKRQAASSETPAAYLSIDWYEDYLQELRNKINATNDVGAAKEMQGIYASLEKNLHELKIKIGIEAPDTKEVQSTTDKIGESINSVFGEIQPLNFDDCTESGNKLQGTIDGISKTVQSAGNAFAAAGQAFDQPVLNIIGTVAQAIATLALTFAQSLKGTFTPWDWIAAAATGTATLLTTIASIKSATAFAEGGVVSGPTYALVGEYAGASNNPEVIAPLNKLRSYIQPAYSEGGNVEFKIKGRELVGILTKESRLLARS